MSPYFIGLALSVLASVATLVVKASITKYPGVGDLWVAYFFAAATGLTDRVAFYGIKALLAASFFSLVYFPFRNAPWFGFRVALPLTVLLLCVMSLGEVVIS